MHLSRTLQQLGDQYAAMRLRLMLPPLKKHLQVTDVSERETERLTDGETDKDIYIVEGGRETEGEKSRERDGERGTERDR